MENDQWVTRYSAKNKHGNIFLSAFLNRHLAKILPSRVCRPRTISRRLHEAPHELQPFAFQDEVILLLASPFRDPSLAPLADDRGSAQRTLCH
jgi:hypothetical protein